MAHARSTGTLRLPVVGEIAREAGTSVSTVLKALAPFRDQGILEVSHGRGIRLLGQSSTSPSVPSAPRGTRYRDAIARALETDILQGRLAPGTLLSASKELQRRFGTSYRTLTRVFADLVERGLLEPHAGTYRVVRMGSKVYGTVAMVLPCDNAGNPLHIPPLGFDLYRQLESACSRNGLSLRLVPYSNMRQSLFSPRPDQDPVESVATKAPIVGTIVQTLTIANRNVERIITRMSRLNRPIVVLDRGGRLRLRSSRARSSHVTTFSVSATPRCGEIMARYLLGLGHRRLVYLSPFRETQWSVNRLAGIERVVRACPDTSLYQVVRSSHSVVAPGREYGAQLQSHLMESLRSFQPAGDLPQATHATVRDHLVAQVPPWADAQARDRVLRLSLDSLFEQALAIENATAWICANDFTALAARNYLARKAVPVPGRLSLVGFDDQPQTSAQLLTSYNFNLPALAELMVRTVIAPRQVRERCESAEIVEVDGLVMERDSSARVARRWSS